MALTVDKKQIKHNKNRLNTLFLISIIKFPTISIFNKIDIVVYYLRYKAKKEPFTDSFFLNLWVYS
jgi:superfamily I DNA and/or RNA helicase